MPPPPSPPDLLITPATRDAPDPRFATVTPGDASELGLADLRRALEVELTPDNLEVRGCKQAGRQKLWREGET